MVSWRSLFIFLFLFLLLAAAACSPVGEIPSLQITNQPAFTQTPTNPPSPQPTSTDSPTLSLTPTHPPPADTATPTPPEPKEPTGCLEPISDYSRVKLNGWTINQRTYQMLEYAAQLYNGKINITADAITQGSYNDNGSASFGTHLGGGVVDISVIQLPEYLVLDEEIEPLIAALRIAGFAAWLREADEVYPDTGIHIHAVAIGDKELSYPAQQQLTGKSGYFRGYDGLPTSGTPGVDRHGGPVICDWMLAAGYSDLRQNTATPTTK